MKKLAAFAAAALFASGFQTADAASLAADTAELRLQGNLDPSTAAGDEFRLAASYGYFFMDNVQAGGRLHFHNDDFVRDFGAGAFIEGNLDTGTGLLPFGEAFAGLSNVDIEDVDDTTALLLELRLGAKYFIADHVALAAAGVFAVATDKIYADKAKLRDTDAFLELSLRCYF